MPLVKVKDGNFKKCLKGYIKAVSKQSHIDNAVSIVLEREGKMTSVQFINALPDTTPITAVSDLDNFKLYLIGPALSEWFETNPDNYIKYKSKKILDDNTKDLRSFPYVETVFWKLYFVNDSLVKYSPEDAKSYIY